MLQEKTGLIRQALKSFQREEEALDLELARLRWALISDDLVYVTGRLSGV